MDETIDTYCRGKRCLLRTNCKRFLHGQHLIPAAQPDGTDKHSWIDNCDEETRELFEPEKSSKTKD